MDKSQVGKAWHGKAIILNSPIVWTQEPVFWDLLSWALPRGGLIVHSTPLVGQAAGTGWSLSEAFMTWQDAAPPVGECQGSQGVGDSMQDEWGGRQQGSPDWEATLESLPGETTASVRTSSDLEEWDSVINVNLFSCGINQNHKSWHFLLLL